MPKKPVIIIRQNVETEECATGDCHVGHIVFVHGTVFVHMPSAEGYKE
jgi:hypothetical protein